MMFNSNDLKKKYNKWITSEFEYHDLDKGVVRIDAPFYDRHNDSLILYALIDKFGVIKLTDGGYVLDDLESSGVYIFKSSQRKKLLKSQLQSYGVQLDTEDHSLFVNTNIEDFPSSKHRLLQAMLFTNDMFMLNKRNNTQVFFEDVAQFLESNNIRAFQNASFTGASGMVHKFEFSIPGIKHIPDKLIKTLNVPNNEMYAKALTTDVHNTAEVVSRPTNFYVFINDTEKEIKPDIISLLKHEKIKVVPFSLKNEYIEELSS